MSTVLHPIDSFTGLFLMYTGLPDCIGNSFQQHHKQHRQNTRQAFSQPLSDSFSYYIFSCPLVLSIISSNSFSKVCLLPKFCVLEKLVTCGVIRSYYSRVSRVFSRYPFSCHGVLLASTHAVSRALRFLMFHAFSVLLLSFYLVPVSFSCFSFFSRYLFSCHVVPFPLFRPSLTRVYEKTYFLIFLILFAEKTLYLQRQTCESTFFPKNCLNTSKMYRCIFDGLEKICRYIFDVPKRRKMYSTLWEVPPLRGGDHIGFHHINMPLLAKFI